MAEAAPALSRHDLEAKIVRRCWEDEAFRKEFTADPVGATVKYLAVPAAKRLKIVVHQETPGSWHIVLPAKPAHAGELSDQELEMAAGGATPTPLAASAASVLTAVSGLSAVKTLLEQGW
jgi:hypothetical protein